MTRPFVLLPEVVESTARMACPLTYDKVGHSQDEHRHPAAEDTTGRKSRVEPWQTLSQRSSPSSA